MTSAAFGAIVGMVIGLYFDRGVFNPMRMCNGALAGLVACTAGVHLMSALDVILVGAAVAAFAGQWLLYRCKLDDPLDVVATHGIAGVVGTVSVALTAPVAALPAGSRPMQFVVQLGGTVVIFIGTFIGATAVLYLINRRWPLRVDPEAEKLGLNYTEHGESIGTDRLKQALSAQVSVADSFSAVTVDPADEHVELASTINQLLAKNESAKEQLELSQRRFLNFAQTASDWLWETDTNMCFTFLEANVQNGTQHPVVEHQVLGQYFFNVIDVDPKYHGVVIDLFSNSQPAQSFEGQLRTGKPEELLDVEVRAVPFFNVADEFQGYRGTISDISLRKAAENRAVYLSLHDELTGLPNRRALSEQLPDVLRAAAHANQICTVAVIDLDGFKSINDTYGHTAGDQLLNLVSERLNAAVRKTDVVYRTGGDEFVLVQGGLTQEEGVSTAVAISNRMIGLLSKDYIIDGHAMQIGASVGIAVYPEHSSNADNLLRLADIALYEAKARGKGKTVLFEKQLDVESQQRVQLESDLRQALQSQQLYLMYQPLFNTVSEGLYGFEALLRWKHPTLGEISPAVFIPIAEQINLMDSIGEFVLREACQFASVWKTIDVQPPRVAVNVSPQQLRNHNFTELVRQTLEDTGVEATMLELEITEEVLVHNFDEVREILLELRNLGVSIAVDDFGSGQTSLRYLNQFPISKLKIDRSFIKNLGIDEKAEEITRSMVDLGRKLGVSVLAEGVEEESQLEILKLWNCDQVQGFLFSKPFTENTVIDYLNQLSDPLRKSA